MHKTDLIAFCKSNGMTLKEVADSLNISQPAVSKWGELVPELQAIKLANLYPGLFYQPELYKKRAA